MPGKARLIEYYRLWPGNNGYGGTWDTAFVAIPANTPDDKITAVAEKAVAAIQWRNEPPVITGIYNVPEPEEEEENHV